MIGNLVTTLRIAQQLSIELTTHTTARRASTYIKKTPISVLFAAACLGSCFLLALIADPAWGATSQPVNGVTATFTLFDSIEQDAETQSNSWFGTILNLVRPTFLILATIEICWAAAIWALEKDNLNSLAVEIIKKIMFIGFFFSLLQFAPEWIPTIADTFVEVGERATGSEAVTTDGIIATGLAVINAIWAKAPTGLFKVLGKLGQILVACFVTLGIIIAYVIIAAQYFTLKVESYILFAAGAIFLGLGSSSWTKEYVSKYLNYAITVGVRLLVMILILSLMLGAINRMSEGFTFDYEPLLKLLAVAILQAILGVRAPEMAGALLSGGVGLSAGTASSAGSSALGGFKSMVGTAVGAATKVAGAVGGRGGGGLAQSASAGRASGRPTGLGGGNASSTPGRLNGLGTGGAGARGAQGPGPRGLGGAGNNAKPGGAKGNNGSSGTAQQSSFNPFGGGSGSASSSPLAGEVTSSPLAGEVTSDSTTTAPAVAPSAAAPKSAAPASVAKDAARSPNKLKKATRFADLQPLAPPRNKNS
jgi:type IV secretion system protein TrbL